MNVLFMIGNGFDLNVGLKTSFKDFLPVYLKTENDDKRIKQFKKDIEHDGIETWAKFESRLGKYPSFTHNSISGDDLIFIRDDFLAELGDYLKTEEKKSNCEDHIGEILRVFNESIAHFYTELPSASLQKIKDIFSTYAHTAHTYNFITFNYTNVLDACIDILKKQPNALKHSCSAGTLKDKINDALHIHGTYSDSPILGVDNALQIKNDDISTNEYFTESLVKPEMNTELGNRNNEIGKNLIDNSTIICVFGMSIGESDKTWWKHLGKWLLLGEPRQLVLVDVEEDYDRSKTTKSIRIPGRIKEHFFEMAEIPSDKRKACKSRIHIGLNTDLFKIDLTPSISNKEPVTV
jgi:hypothetical protein